MEKFDLKTLFSEQNQLIHKLCPNPFPSKLLFDDDRKKTLVRKLAKGREIERRKATRFAIPQCGQSRIMFRIAHPETRSILDLSQIVKWKPLQNPRLQKPIDEKAFICCFRKTNGN